MKFKATILAALMGFGLLASVEADADCITNANGSVTCGTADQMPSGSLNTTNNNNNTTPNHFTPGHKPKWFICINGVDIKTGLRCHDDWNFHHHRRIKATGDDAVDVLVNMRPVLGSGYDSNGYYRQIGIYNGTFRPAQGRMFRCLVAPNGYDLTCVSLN